MWNVVDSVFKKVTSVSDAGMDAIQEAIKQGEMNYQINDPYIEEVAKKRAKFLLENDMLADEPIKAFRFEDERIPEISNKMLKECGCPAGKFVRQNIITHNYWI